MHPVAPAPGQVCGRCRKFEPRSDDPNYGYCRLSLVYDSGRGRGVVPVARPVDVSHPCFMVQSPANRPAFVAKEPT